MSLWDDVHRVPGPLRDWAGVEAFNVSDVLSMFWEAPDDAVRWDKLPNVAPPFRLMFFWGKSPRIVVGGETRNIPAFAAEQGALFRATKAGGGWEIEAVYVNAFGDWIPAQLEYRLDGEGRLSGIGSGRTFSARGDTGFLRGCPNNDPVGHLSVLLYPFMLATSILHCKNVTARHVHPPEKLAKAAAKRGRPIYSYSVLDVKPMRRILDDEGGMSQGASLAKALHVCRGHFKDYRDGAGLFGKVKGLYWWEQSLRGNVVNGVHVKDYRVKA